MPQTPLFSLSTRSLLALLGAASCSWAASAQSEPFVYLRGTVRDFRLSHADFSVAPPAGTGHFAGNLTLVSDARHRPQFTGGGFKVLTDWRNGGSEPIAPHLFQIGGPTVEVVVAPGMQPNAVADTWDPAQGPYGPPNVGPEPIWVVGAAMPAVSAPAGMGPSVGNVTYSSNATLSADLHCDQLTIRNGRTLTISGARTILCDGLFEMKNSSSVVLAPGATLSLYLNAGATLRNSEQLNANTGDPTRLAIVNLGVSDFDIKADGQVYATMVSPGARIAIKSGGDFYGSFRGHTVDLWPNSGFHAVGTWTLDACGNPVQDTAGTAGVNSTGGISSAASFEQWYTDVMGTNLSLRHTLALVHGGGGVYEFLSDSFYPIDGRAFGNEGESHNSNFTLALGADFVYEACTGQFFEFEGHGDVWVFIDHALTIDLGGVDTVRRQYVDLEHLALVDGQAYHFDFFHAHRHSGPSVFRVRTNLAFTSSVANLAASAPHD